MVVGEFTHETDLLVIGGGPGGYSAAFRAASNGIQTTIVEASKALGGVCLHRGCIPSKTLLHMAEVIASADHAREMGIEFGDPKINIKKAREWKQTVIDKLSRGLGAVAKKLKVEVIQGKARFEDGRHVALDESEVKRIKFKRAIIATGSVATKLPPSIQIDSAKVVNSRGVLELSEVPKHLLVVGGGYIGLELGTVSAALGSSVTVVEMLDSLLPGCDADLVKPLAKRLGSQLEEICLETRVTAMKETKNGIQVSFEGKNVPKRKTFDQVLVAVGRSPNTRELNLEAANVAITERGFIKVDAQFQTTSQRIYAIGDAIGDPMLAHKAIAEGKVLADQLAGKDAVFEPRCIPAVVFTDPEIAWTGLTENEAKKNGTPIEVKKMQWMASGRAMSMGRTEGLTKIIFDPKTERVLGVGMVGVHVGEMIAEASLAIEMGAVATDIALTIHPHPTVSELFSDVADLMASPGGTPAH